MTAWNEAAPGKGGSAKTLSPATTIKSGSVHTSPSTGRELADAAHDHTRQGAVVMTVALQWAAQGLRVHPLRPGTKVPLLADWPTAATTDSEVIRDWWVQTPDANVGIATGKGSDLFVLDVDTNEGKVGQASLDALTAEHGPLPETLVLRTANGGLHYCFRFPEGEGEWRNTASSIAPDLDTRAEGGQIAAYPSRLVGDKQYDIESEHELAECPEWLAVLARRQPSVAPERPEIDLSTLRSEDLDQAGRYGIAGVNAELKRLRELCRDATPTGKGYTGKPWNDTTFQVACSIIEIANAPWSTISENDAYRLCISEAPRDSGFTNDTVNTIWTSAVKKVNGKARALPASIGNKYLKPTSAEDSPFAGSNMMRRLEGAKFEPQTLAEALMNEGTLAWGVDDSTWTFRAGGWVRDEDEIMRRVGYALGNDYRPERFRAVRDLVKTQIRIRCLGGEEPDGEYINLRNGMLHWRTGVLKPHDPSYLSTVQLPHEYNPEATCPDFDNWLTQVIPADTLEMIWEVIGYLVMAGNPLQVAVLLHGDGGNGKGTFLRVMQRVLGRRNVSSVTLDNIVSGKFEAVEMHGKIANIAGDLDPTYLKRTATFKEMTGGDTMQVQRKNQRPFEMTCWAVPVFSANEFWRSSDTSEGYFRRWVALPFPVKVRELDVAFNEADILGEAEGIIAKAVPALQRLMARGRFEPSHSSNELMADFRTQSDSARTWLAEDHWLDFHDPRQVEVKYPKPDLYRRYRDWCTENGHVVMSSAKWWNSLELLGYTKTKIQGTDHVKGLSGSFKQRTPLYMGTSDF